MDGKAPLPVTAPPGWLDIALLWGVAAAVLVLGGCAGWMAAAWRPRGVPLTRADGPVAGREGPFRGRSDQDRSAAPGPADPWQIEVLARTVYGEARGEPRVGQVAVAWVFVNRAHDVHMRWPVTVAGACLERAQASCWDDGDSNRPRLMACPSDDPELTACRLVAGIALAGSGNDPTGGANHYLRADLAATSPPFWYDPAKVMARIGRHEFLKL